MSRRQKFHKGRKIIYVPLKQSDSRETKISAGFKCKISVSLLDLNVINNYGGMSLVKPDLTEITIPSIFCGFLREKNTHLERLDDTTDRYDTRGR